MIIFNMTLMGEAYTQYKNQYHEGLARNLFEIYSLNDTSYVAINRQRNQLPKINLPYVVSSEDKLNTHNKLIVMLDGTNIRDVEADFRLVNGYLTAMWEDPLIGERFMSVRKFATKAYMNWVSRSLVGRFNLAFDDKMVMDVLCAAYYYCASDVPEKYFGQGEYKAYADLAEITQLSATRVESVIKRFGLDDRKEVYRINDLAYDMQQISDDTKHKISVPNITATLAHSWYGESGVFYCNLAVEYPPMFLTLLYFGLVDTSFKRSRFATVVKEFSIGRNVEQGDNFVRQISAIVKGINPKQI